MIARRARAAGLAPLLVLAAGCRHVPPQPLSADESARAFAARSLADPGLRAFLEAARGAPLAEWPLRRMDLPTSTLVALYFQPKLAVARADAALAAAAIRTAGARPNPTLSVAPEFSTNPEAGISPWLATVHLDWPIETAGKRRHRIERAAADAEARRIAISEEAWRVELELASVVVDLDAAQARLRSLRRDVETAQELVRLVEDRVESGAASSTELAPLRFALLQSTAEEAAGEAALGTLRAQLAAALGLPEPACAAVEVLPPPPADGSPLLGIGREEALREALHRRADVRAALASYAASEAALALELARQYPDLHLGTGYQFDQGQNKWSIGLSIDLPVLDQNQGPIAEAEAAREATAARFVATQAQAIAEVEQALAKRDGARRQRERLAAGEAERVQNLERVRSAVALGAADRPAELAARLDRIRAGRAASDAEAALQHALAELAAALEVPLPGTGRALDDGDAGPPARPAP